MSIEKVYTRNVIGTPRSTLVGDAAALMRKHRVGTLLVTEDGPGDRRAIGIVTDRDLVVHAMARGIAPDAITVGDVMTPALASVPASADLHEALETMRTNGVRRLVVIGDGGDIVGIMSLDDMIDALATDLSSLADIVRRQCELESAANV